MLTSQGSVLPLRRYRPYCVRLFGDFKLEFMGVTDIAASEAQGPWTFSWTVPIYVYQGIWLIAFSLVRCGELWRMILPSFFRHFSSSV